MALVSSITVTGALESSPLRPHELYQLQLKKQTKKRNLPLMRGNINFIDLEVNTDFSEWWTSLSWD